MGSLPLYREVKAGGRDFLLVHGGLGHFSPSRSLENYSRDEIVWCRPEPETEEAVAEETEEKDTEKENLDPDAGKRQSDIMDELTGQMKLFEDE